MFVTSVSGNGNLASWADAAGETGLAAADAVCRARASAASLSNPENFVAWLSDSADDAYCRLHGLTGKRSAFCGLPSLPIAAGPWIRTDGSPWAGPVEDLLSSSQKVYHPPGLDEFGTPLPESLILSASGLNGAVTTNGDIWGTCNDFTSLAGFVLGGNSTQTSQLWGAGHRFNCNNPELRLLCLERLPGAPLPPSGELGLQAFVTSVAGPGDLTSWVDLNGVEGPAAGDRICRYFASLVDLRDPNSYKAWLSAGNVDAKDRFSADGPWVRTDGIRFASSLADLTDGLLITSLNVSEIGEYKVGIAWTGTTAAGIASGADCGAWTQLASMATVGRINDTLGTWAQLFDNTCNGNLPIYCLSDAGLARAHRTAFVTSVEGTGDLASWADAGGASGLQAADAICAARAAAASLPDSLDFVAWLSDSTDDAYCRLHGLTGRRSSNCGLPSLPPDAGPWVRTDDSLWAGPLSEFINGSEPVFHPLALDEFGNLVPSARVFTATLPDGSLYTANTCTDWSSTGSAASGGHTSGTTGLWSSGFVAASCSTPARLYCLERGPGRSLPALRPRRRIAFLSSAGGSGDLGSWPRANGEVGVAAGDAICRDLASSAGLTGAASFKAWLSTSTADAKSRFVHDGPWDRVDGVRVVGGLGDLTDGLLRTSIGVTERGEYQDRGVWTGTTPAGNQGTDTCSDWTDGTAGSQGLQGVSSLADGFWTQFLPSPCGAPFNLYCLSDVPELAPVESPGLYASADAVDEFYTLDLLAGTPSLVGPATYVDSEGVQQGDLVNSGLSYDSSTRTLYTYVLVSGGFELASVDLRTGGLTLLGRHDAAVYGLAYDAGRDELFAAGDSPSGGPGGLLTVDRASGAATMIGPFSPSGDVSIFGLAYDATTDTLFGVDSQILYAIDRLTGAANPVGPLGVTLGQASGSIGLAADGDSGVLYATDDVTQVLYSVDKATGAATPLGATRIGISGLAFLTAGPVFSSGFESGDTSDWSRVLP